MIAGIPILRVTALKIPFLFLPALLLLLPLRAPAQTSVYGTISVTDYGYTASSTSSAYTYKGDTAGMGGGVTWLFPSQSRLKAGLDGRFSYSPGNRGGEDASLSLRIAFVPHRNPVRPYFQIGGGFVHVPGSSYIVGTSNGYLVSEDRNLTGGTANLMFGLEVRANSRWAIRAIELSGQASNRVAASHLGAGVIYTLGSTH